MTDFSHRIPLQIAAADYAGRAMAAPLDDERICYGIVHTHLQLASAYPARQLEQLYQQWTRMEPVHPAYDRAICIGPRSHGPCYATRWIAGGCVMTSEGLIANPFSRLRTQTADGEMAIDRSLQADMMRVFREWNSTRIARFFDVNQRTAQRWLKDDSDPKALAVPDDLRLMLREQVVIEEREHFFDELRTVLGDAQQAGIHKEVLCAWLAVLHRDYSGGREIE